jgi:two-component system, LuxR family, response regulator FixJ
MLEHVSLAGHVYIVDDDPSMCQALTFALTSAGHQVHAYTRPEDLIALDVIQGPAVLLLDMRLHQGSGVQVQARLVEQGLRTPVVFMSGQSQPHEIVQSFRQGALHFLLKPFSTTDLLMVLDEALRQDQARLDREAQERQLALLLQRLTPREREVCRLMLKGYPNRDIAQAHGTVPGTVKLQRASVMEKLQVSKMSELARLFEGEDPDRLLDAQVPPVRKRTA